MVICMITRIFKCLQKLSCCFQISYKLISSIIVFFFTFTSLFLFSLALGSVFFDFQTENYSTWDWAGTSGSRVQSTRVSVASAPEGAGSQTLPDQQAPGCYWLHQRPRPFTTTCQAPPLPPTLQCHQPGSQSLPEGGCGGSPKAEGKRGSLCRTNVWELLSGGEGSPRLQSCPQRLAVSLHSQLPVEQADAEGLSNPESDLRFRAGERQRFTLPCTSKSQFSNIKEPV